MEIVEIPYCCGAILFAGLPGDEDDFPATAFDVDSTKEYLISNINRMSNVGIFEIYINEFQKEALGSMLESVGFEEVSYGRNKNSGYTIHLYTFQRKTWENRKKAG